MESVKKHIPSFIAKLECIDISNVSSNAYAQQYLHDLLLHKEHYLHLYALVLDKAFDNLDTSVADACLLDFGCGNGLLALFAKHCGISKVYASDMSEAFIQAAKAVSMQLHIHLDGWLVGNENKLLEHFAPNQLTHIVATDVIEHVYSLDNLFRTIRKLNGNMITVFTTASVAENPLKNAKLKALQRKDELESSNAFHSAYENEFTGLSFLAIRKKLIAAKYTSLTKDEVNDLAIASRGLVEAAIYQDVEQYLATKKMPMPIKHPTNTCDPFTGSWTERLLTIKEYEQLYKRYQFSLQIGNGFYNAFEANTKSKIAVLLNKVIQLVGSKGICITPFIVLIGKPNKN
jgi:2-polyprenyl-3-methyl-5-hydroxy-6-metoxy-1,4-benzoquinol methylase